VGVRTIGQQSEAAVGEANQQRRFGDRLRDAMRRANTLLCVGLDPDLARFPVHLRDSPDAIVRFNAAIIEATADLVCAYKPNLGFYAAHGVAGIEALVATRRLVPDGIPVILDCKVGDMDNTAAAYARGYFDAWGFDAVTANPYLGEDSLAPFLAYADRGVIVLAKTSNPDSGQFQDLPVDDAPEESVPLYLHIAGRAAEWATRYPATVGLVVGATYPAELAAVRARCPELPILLPGVGAQAGDVAAAVRAGVDAWDGGLVVASSRGIIYAGDGADFAARAREAALRLRDEVNAARRTDAA
jgi:orotidine-5'-phosphate decarboxylase